MRDAFHSPTKLTPVTVLADFAPSVHQRGVGRPGSCPMPVFLGCDPYRSVSCVNLRPDVKKPRSRLSRGGTSPFRDKRAKGLGHLILSCVPPLDKCNYIQCCRYVQRVIKNSAVLGFLPIKHLK